MVRKLSLLLLLSYIGAACNSIDKGKKYSFLHFFVGTLDVDRSRNVLIYTINPNDCINCLRGFVIINNELSKLPSPKIYIILTEREIEKNALIASVKNMPFTDSINRRILWDKDLFEKTNTSVSVKNEISLSLLTIYNYEKDSVVFTKPIKEIMDVEELSGYLK